MYTERIFNALKELQAELEATGIAEVNIIIEIVPNRTPGKKRLTNAQSKLLSLLERNGVEKRGLTPAEKRTMQKLINRGLATETWIPPGPGNDYGGKTIYKITPAGKKAYQEELS